LLEGGGIAIRFGNDSSRSGRTALSTPSSISSGNSLNFLVGSFFALKRWL